VESLRRSIDAVDAYLALAPALDVAKAQKEVLVSDSGIGG